MFIRGYHQILALVLFLPFADGCSKHDAFKPKPTNSTKNKDAISAPYEKQKYYEVKKGDTLYSIGLHNKLDFKKLAAWNQIKPPYNIEVGQIIRLYDLAADSNPQSAVEITSVHTANVSPPISHKSTNNRSLQISQMVSEVLAANPQIEVAQAVWEASTAQVKQQGAFEDPKLSYSLAPLTIDNTSTDFVQQIQLSQHIPWPGKLSLQSDVAKSNAVREKEKINELRLKLTALAKKIFSDWYFIHQAIQIHHENAQLLEHIYSIAQARYRVGKASQQEVLQAELEASLLEQHQLLLNQRKSEILGHINTLLSRPINSPLPNPSLLAEPLSMQTIRELHQDELENHPKIKALSANVQALKLNRQRAGLSALPDFKINAGYSTIMDNSDKHWIVGLAVNLPLDRNKYRAIQDEATARLKQAQWQKQDQGSKIGRSDADLFFQG